MTELKEFKCDNGKVYKFPKNHCLFCKNCTDIFFDYTSGPYLFPCNIGKDGPETCNSFVGDDEDE